MHKIALDTNIILSGLFFEGNERCLLIAGLTGKYTLVISREIMEETQAIVERKFKGSGQTDEAMLFLGDMVLASEYHHGPYQKGIMDSAAALIRDRKDVIHAAFILTVDPDIFVTGDKDFLEHPKIGSTLVMKTKEVLILLEG